MKHFYTSIAAVAASLLLSANAQSKLDLQSRIQLEEYRSEASVVNQSETAISDFGRLVPKSALPSFAPGVAPMKMAFVGINDGYSVADLEAAGYEVLSNLGKVAIVNVSMDDVETMSELDVVKSVQLGRKLHKCTDKARDISGVTPVHNGFDYNGNNLQFDGSGVFTAIYDAGIAPNHLNFFDEDGNSRVKRVLCYLEDEEDSKKINIYDFDTPEKVALFQTDDEQETHGTHTLGILAGGYKGAAKYCAVTPNADYTAFIDSTTVTGNNPFYGVATGSDILVGCGTFDDAVIAHAATQMALQAAEEGKPIVFSCSIGSNIGAHDGSDYLSQTLTTLAEDYNLIPVLAAGNEGADKMSVRKSFTSSSDKLVTCVTPLSGYSQCYSLVDFWSDSSEPFTLKVTCYTKNFLSSANTTDIFTVNAAGQSYEYTSSNNSTLKSAFSSATVIALSEEDKNNGRFHTLMLFNYTRKSLSSSLLYVTVTYQSGRTVTGVINNYGEFTSQSAISGSVAGTGDFSISTMACSPSVISVGAYNSRGMWNRLGGGVQGQKNFQEKAVTSFSSYGMADDGRQLPTLLGPGTNVMSSYNPYYLTYNVENNTGSDTPGTMSCLATDSEGNPFYWGAMSGTSMATPFVAGSIALWLEADPTLNVNDIKDIIAKTSTMDDAISSSPERAGAGRINVQEGIIEILRNSLAGMVNIEKDAVKPFVTVSGTELTVTAPGVADMTVDIFNMMGVQVVSTTVDDDVVTCSTSDFTPGVYLLKVTTPAGVSTQKVVIP